MKSNPNQAACAHRNPVPGWRNCRAHRQGKRSVARQQHQTASTAPSTNTATWKGLPAQKHQHTANAARHSRHHSESSSQALHSRQQCKIRKALNRMKRTTLGRETYQCKGNQPDKLISMTAPQRRATLVPDSLHRAGTMGLFSPQTHRRSEEA